MTPGPPRAAGRRAVAAWCLFDWANSAYPTLIATFVFATYFTQGVAESPEAGTALWGNAMALSGLLIAVLAPLAGAVADQTGARKPWLAGFSGLCMATTALLWFVAPEPAFALLALGLVVVSNLGFELGMVFYNAMLPDITPRDRLGRVSGWAWGLGYAGGLVCLVVALFGLIQAEPPPFGLAGVEAGPVRASVLLVAGWFLVFSLPLYLWVPDRPGRGQSAGAAIRAGMADLRRTLVRLKDAPHGVGRFLIARMIYTDGLNTLFAFGGIYAAGSFGMGVDQVIVFGIAMNVSAGLGAVGFGWIDDRLGSKRTIAGSLVAMIGLGAALVLIEDVTLFWVAALALGVFFGPVQASSRAMMARLAPPDQLTELFGLYALSGRITSFLGPLVLAWTTAWLDSQRAGMATILVFLALGLGLLVGVRERRA
ncbi:MFS transporter [Roseospirillum parvum]|uniref:MFS transporter, UMF1 family n=1 Tax=Roseospirillum parvum TaxID=83401 RepID=A0A1G8FTE4_9PROT|nr:MFS transporter [Roseospirillum parvum]SDH85402.1 MFS transporter, UMF1 family [Roseospirillum parvum]